MALNIRSPHSGRPVKVREEDVGRAIRDEAGLIFYVVPRSDGQGYYAATTRAGSPEQEQRYLELEQQPIPDETAHAMHDATGPGRPIKPARLVALVAAILIFLAAATGYWIVFIQPDPADIPTPPAPEQTDEPEPEPQTLNPDPTPLNLEPITMNLEP